MHRAMAYHALVQEHLAEVVRHIQRGERLIAEQRARVEHARAQGLDVTDRVTTLKLLEDTQVLHVAHRERLCAELTALSERSAEPASSSLPDAALPSVHVPDRRVDRGALSEPLNSH